MLNVVLTACSSCGMERYISPHFPKSAVVGLSVAHTDVQNSACLEFYLLGYMKGQVLEQKVETRDWFYHILVVVTTVKDNPDELMQAACWIYTYRGWVFSFWTSVVTFTRKLGLSTVKVGHNDTGSYSTSCIGKVNKQVTNRDWKETNGDNDIQTTFIFERNLHTNLNTCPTVH
jgi:hypothetical protein